MDLYGDRVKVNGASLIKLAFSSNEGGVFTSTNRSLELEQRLVDSSFSSFLSLSALDLLSQAIAISLHERFSMFIRSVINGTTDNTTQ